MEKAFATCYFSIILISLRVGVVPFQIFLAHATIFQPHPVNNVSSGKETVPHHYHLCPTPTETEGKINGGDLKLGELY